jgi:IrrE N-terminal-like domain
MGTQHIVPELSREKVFIRAFKTRSYFKIDDVLNFNIVNLLDGLKGIKFKDDYILSIVLFTEERVAPAYVDFLKPCESKSGKVILYVHEEVWKLANMGDPKSRYILAHELGHIILHRGERQEYSDTGASRYKAFPPERQAENQANWFADAFLAPDNLVSRFSSPLEFSLKMDFPGEYAVRRFDEVQYVARKFKSFRQRDSHNKDHIGEACSICANFTLVRNGSQLRCDICHSTKEVNYAR